MGVVQSFGDRLREALAASGLSAADVYKRLGVSKATWYTWTGERGSVPEPSTCLKLAEILGVRAPWLIAGDGPRIKPVTQFTQEQIDVAEAWPYLPPHAQAAIASIIRAAVMEMAPALRGPLSRTHKEAQERANRLLEAAQATAQKPTR